MFKSFNDILLSKTGDEYSDRCHTLSNLGEEVNHLMAYGLVTFVKDADDEKHLREVPLCCDEILTVADNTWRM